MITFKKILLTKHGYNSSHLMCLQVKYFSYDFVKKGWRSEELIIHGNLIKVLMLDMTR